MKNAAPHRQLRNHLMNPIRRVEGRVGVAGVDENDSRERQTDRHFTNLQASFSFSSHFLFTSWFPLEYITRILWCPHVLFFFPSSLLFTSCLFLLIWALKARLIYHGFESLHLLALFSPGLWHCSQMLQICSAPPLLFLTACALGYLNSHLGKARKCQQRTAWPQLLQPCCHFYLCSQALICCWNAGHFFSSLISKLAKGIIYPQRSSPCFIW